MKTKLVLIPLIIIILIIILNINTSDKNTNVKKESSTILKMSHNLPINSALHEASLLYAEKIKEKTNNKIQIIVYPAQKLGDDYKTIELTRLGKIDILLTPTSKMSTAVPSMQYADIPFLFPTREDAYSLLDGKVGQMILSDLNDIDLRGVTFWENGFKHFTANSQLISPKDFENKKIRVMKSRIIMEQFKALGAKAIPIDFHKTKKALADKVVDGQENPLVAIVNMEFHKVQSNLTISEHAYLPYTFSISKKSISKFSIDIQNILINTAIEVTTWEREETQRREELFLETIKKANVNVHILNQKEKKEFYDATKYITQMYEDVIGSHIISKTQEVLYNKYKTKDTVAIGIDVDLSIGNRGSGLAIKRGVEIAIDEINKNGGLLGKKISIVTKNHKSISTQAIKNIKTFIDDPNIKAIIGGKQSAIISGEIKHIQKGKIPFITPWAAAEKIINNGYKDNYLFRVSLNDKIVMKTLLNETLKNDKKPLVILENSIWGRDALSHIQKLTINKKPLDFIIVNRGESSFNHVIKTIKDKDIDSIIMVLNSKEGTKVFETIAKNNLGIPIVSHWGIIGDKFFQTNKSYLETVDLKFIQTFSFITNENSISSIYLKKYGKNSIKDIVAPTAVAQAYDAMNLIALAINNAKSFNRKQIKKHLEQISTYDGLVKKYNNPFSKNDHEALNKNDLFFAKYNKNGLIIPIKR